MDRAGHDGRRGGVAQDVGGGVRVGDGGAAALAGVVLGPAPVPAPAALAAVPTDTAPVMPAAAWPGIVQMKASPPAGTVTVPVAVCLASAASLVPSAKVRS